MKYVPTIGLEIHAELKTKTKMFCDSPNMPDESHPNVSICPVCTGAPGTLPVINREAISLMIKIGLALDGKIANVTKFDRKNYFYPDLPKGYQISQYDEPIVSDGRLMGVRIRRVHLEEDAGRLVHDEKSGASLVDYNRAGLPLMELVTEPDFKDGQSARAFAEEFQQILRYLGASSADMEHGQMRVEANVSVAPEGAPWGTKVEVKNLNSFRAVEGAIAHEIERQSALLEEGKSVVQETRGWDDVKLVTVSQRRKEEAHDYRYFPEPDLPPLNISEMGLDLEKIRNELPELPAAKRARFAKEFGLTAEQAMILAADKAWADYFEAAISELGTEAGGKNDRARLLCYNYLTSDFKGLLEERSTQLKASKVTPENFADLIVLIATDKISSRTAKDVMRKMEESGEDPRVIIEREGLAQESSSGALEAIAKEILAANPKAVEDYKKGKPASLQFLVGKAMARMLGKGNPPMLQEIFKKLLG